MTLAVRSMRAEQMDAPGLDAAVYGLVLSDLARVNRWTLAARPTLGFLDRAIEGATPFRLLDVGFGNGDMLRAIARWAARRGCSPELVGVDLNPKSRAAAEAATASDLPISYVTGDYRDLAGGFDIIVSSLVAHHMSPAELGQFIAFMEREARRGWLINDLHRHGFAHAAYPLLATLLGVHPMVREDGRLSIARGFRPAEWADILAGAGVPLDAARVVRRFPFRLCVERLR